MVMGDDESCYEVIDELRLNELDKETGLITTSQPKRDPGVDYMVGELADEETLRKAEADKAEYLIICTREDSQAIHLTLLIRKINPETRISAIAKNAETEELLRQAGAHYTLSTTINPATRKNNSEQRIRTSSTRSNQRTNNTPWNSRPSRTRNNRKTTRKNTSRNRTTTKPARPKTHLQNHSSKNKRNNNNTTPTNKKSKQRRKNSNNQSQKNID